MSAIHQFVPMLHVGDAVGSHTTAVQALLRRRGVRSEIYVELPDPDTEDRARPAAAYPDEAEPGDLLVYQFATASALAGWLADRPEALVVNYHNVTPPALFAAWDNGLARHQVRAHLELAELAARAVLGVAVSEHNRADLVASGYAATAMVPPVVDLAGTAAPAGPGVTGGAAAEVTAGAAAPAAASTSGPGWGWGPGVGWGTEPDLGPGPWLEAGGGCRDRGARWLSVGRLAPNKAVEDVIAALLAYRERHDPAAELLVVGRPALAGYSAALHRYAAALGLAGAVHFTGRVSPAALDTAYADADVLVVASEHEGFCLPVVEAMAHDLPVVAYRQGALPEVLGDAGVLLDRKDPLSMADAVRRLLADGTARAAAVAAGRARLVALDLASAGPRLADLLVAVRDGAPWPDEVALQVPAPPAADGDGPGDAPAAAEPPPAAP